MLRQRVILIFLLLFVVFVPSLRAESSVSGRYGGGGTQVQITLSVGAPPPAAFIVLQQLPAGVQLVNASPPPSGANGQQVKWLFKRPQSGGAVITMQFSRPVAVRKLRGEISFRHPQNGKMSTARIR